MLTWNNDWNTYIEIEAKRERYQKQLEQHERNGAWYGDSEREANETTAGDGLRRQRSREIDLGGILAQACVPEPGGRAERSGDRLDGEA